MTRCPVVAVVLAALAAPLAGQAVREIPFPDAKGSFDYTKIDRALTMPACKSDKPGYRFYAFGPAGRTIMATVLDESKGTGTGYDTLYVDLDLDGNLTDDGEKYSGEAGCKPSPFRAMEGRDDLFVIPRISWLNGAIKARALDVPDPKLRYSLSTTYSFTRIDVQSKEGGWGFPMRVMDGGVPWGTVKAKAPVLRFGGTAWTFNNPDFVSRKAGRKSERVGTGEGTPPAEPGDKVWVDGTKAFFAGSSPEVLFGHGKVYAPWSDRAYTVRIEGADGKVLARMSFQNSCGGNRWATTLITGKYPDGRAQMVFDMDTGSTLGHIVQRVPFRVSNPNYGKPLPELEITRALRRDHPGATVLEIYQGADLSALGIPEYDGARDVYFGMVGLGTSFAQSCTNVGNCISFGTDIRNVLHLGGEGRRALIKFDLGMLAPQTKVVQAVLAMKVLSVNAKVDPRTRVYAMRKRWSEVLARDGGGLYRKRGAPRRYLNNWPVGQEEEWAKPMFEGNADRHADPVGEVSLDKPGWADVDVTEAVRNWVSDAWPNDGLALAMAADRRVYGTHDIAIQASDYPSDPRVRPCLVVVIEGTPQVKAYRPGEAGDDLASASSAARKAGKPLLVCALSGGSLTSRAFEAGPLANRAFRDWAEKHFVTVRLHAGRPESGRWLADHGVRRFPSLIVMSPDPDQPDNYALIQPLDWDVPDGIFRSSFAFEQLVAKNLQNVLDRAKGATCRYGLAGTCGLGR